MKKLCTLLILSLLFSLQIISAPYNGDIFKFKQPDGTYVEARIFGDEYYSRCESLDGFTLIRDESTGWLCYAKLSDDKTTLVSTGIKYKGAEVQSTLLKSGSLMDKGIDIPYENKMQIVNKNKSLLSDNSGSPLKSFSLKSASPNVPQTSGYFKGITILVDFSDEPAPLDVSVYDDMMNGASFTTDGNNGSVKQYYNDISNGAVTYENVVYGWFRAPKTFAEYDAMGYAVGAQQILQAALEWVDGQGFDFSTLTTDGSNRILAINLMYTGHPKEWAKGMWWHKSGYTGFSADGVTSKVYNCSPANSPLSIGTVCHENGHMLCNYPDIYQYSGREEGIGGWDLMCSSGGTNPPPPDPYLRYKSGWMTEVLINPTDTELTSVSNDFNVFKYVNPADSKEFFYIESKQKVGRNSGIPDEGLTIWHINENGTDQPDNIEDQVVNIFHSYNSISSHKYACYHAKAIDEISEKTLPASNWRSGENSGIRIYQVSDVGTSMTFKVSFEASDMLDKSNWTKTDSSYVSASYSIFRLIDKNPITSFIGVVSPTTPMSLSIDLGAEYDLTKLQCLPKVTDGANSIISYEFYVSDDGINWGTAVSSGTWVQDNTLKIADFNATGRYVKIVGLSSTSAEHDISVSELNLFGTITATSLPNKAHTPVPADNQILVEVDGNLEWIAGDGAATHNVYLSEDATIEPAELVASQAGTSYTFTNLKTNHQYYWRVDEVNANGTTTGTTWSFSTIADNVALNKEISSSTNYNTTYVATKANDGDFSSDASRWLSQNGAAYPHWVEINLKDIYAISGLRLYTGYGGYNLPINDFKFQYWENGAWTDLLNITGNTEPVKYWSFNETNVTKVRLYVSKVEGDIVKLYEIQVYGQYASDCNGDVGGTAYYDDCDICVEGNTSLLPCTTSNSDDLESVNELKYYPNPADKVLYIDGTTQATTVELYNLLGERFVIPLTNGQINIEKLKKGMYFIQIDENKVFKFIKK